MPTTIFEFERDFAGSLRCIPMAVRLKLDLVGIKLSLRQWSRLDREQRGKLLQATCDSMVDRSAYIGLIEDWVTSIGGDIERIATVDGFAWSKTDEVPEVVLHQSAEKYVPAPTPSQWRRLTELQRFSLIKLTRPGHENENFVPAMREFGLLSVSQR